MATFSYSQTDSAVCVTHESTPVKAAPRTYSNYIGVAAGYVTGYGLSIRKWFNTQWGLQVNLFPIYYQEHYKPNDNNSDRDSGYSTNGTLSLGLTYLKKLTDFGRGRVVYYVGGNIESQYKRYDYYTTTDSLEYITDPLGSVQYVYTTKPVHETGHSMSNKISIGGGAGAEFYIWRFAPHVMLGICCGYETVTKSFSVLPSIEGGLQFRL
jgi:hypothetical protein